MSQTIGDAGLIDLEGNLYFMLVTKTSAGVPTAPTGSVTYKVYHPSSGVTSPMTNGTGTMTGSVDGDTTLFVSAALACTAANGYASGERYFIKAVYTVSGSAQSQEFGFTVT